MNMEVKSALAAGPLLADAPEIARVGVVGAGQMGNGIAHVCALSGLPVTMLDVRAEALEKARGLMARNMDRQVNRRLISAEARDAAMARVETSTDYGAFSIAALPPWVSTGSKLAALTVTTFLASDDFTVASALPA